MPHRQPSPGSYTLVVKRADAAIYRFTASVRRRDHHKTGLQSQRVNDSLSRHHSRKFITVLNEHDEGVSLRAAFKGYGVLVVVLSHEYPRCPDTPARLPGTECHNQFGDRLLTSSS